MAIVRASTNLLWADLLADLTGAGTDDSIAVGMIAWAEDQINWYHCTATVAATSTWVATASGASSWADVLGVGALSGANNPILTDGQDFQGEDATGANGGALTLRGGNVTGGGNGGTAKLQGGTADTGGSGGSVQVIASAGGSASGAGGSIIGSAGGASSATAANAGGITFTAGSATNGGGSGDGGTISLQPGTAAGSGTAGRLLLDYSTWPGAEGTSGQSLQTDGAGALSWASGTSAPSQWIEVTTQTTGTGAGSETFTLATVDAVLPTDTQNWVEIRIIGEDTTNPDTHTFFTREIRTYYRGAGGATLWSNELVGTEQNRGFGTEITSVDLTLNGNAVEVVLTQASSTRTIDWCVQYITKDTVSASSAGISATAGQVLTFDNRGAPLTTGNATGGGGTTNFTMDVGASYGELKYLRVRTATGACADATIQFFYDAARTPVTGEIYDAENKDTSTTNGWVDRNPATMMGDDGTALESNTLYGTITNVDVDDATFSVELVFWSDGTVANSLPPSFTGLKTGAYTAVAGERVKFDPSGGTFPLDFPAFPAPDTIVSFKNCSTSTTAITLDGNGSNVEDPASPGGGSATVSMSGAGAGLDYQYDGTQWWIV